MKSLKSNQRKDKTMLYKMSVTELHNYHVLRSADEIYSNLLLCARSSLLWCTL